MKIGFLQFAPELANLQANVEKVTSFLQNIREVDILVLPELANSGYNFSSQKEAFNSSEIPAESPFVKLLQQESNRLDALIITGFNEREGDKLFNSSLLIDKTGIVGKYRKLHLFYREKEFFTPGNLGLPVFEYKGVKLGVLVCFDWIFPESWRILALKGVQLVAHCANLVLPGMAQRAVPVQAMMNRIFVICANRIGEERGLQFTGNSLLSSEKGEILTEASADREEIKIVEVDLNTALNKQITPLNNLWSDRRTDIYQCK